MSILIKGMEMPKPGRYEATIYVGDDGISCIAVSPEAHDIGYWDEYPLVLVPPHGDLIDRDALMKRMWEETDCMISVPATFVRDSPTIIPAEEGEG